MVRQDLQILHLHLVQFHESWQEVNHWSFSGVLYDGDRPSPLLQLRPGRRVWHRLRSHPLHRVKHTRRRLSAHTFALQRRITVRVRHQLNQVSIVDHRVV